MNTQKWILERFPEAQALRSASNPSIHMDFRAFLPLVLMHIASKSDTEHIIAKCSPRAKSIGEALLAKNLNNGVVLAIAEVIQNLKIDPKKVNRLNAAVQRAKDRATNHETKREHDRAERGIFPCQVALGYVAADASKDIYIEDRGVLWYQREPAPTDMTIAFWKGEVPLSTVRILDDFEKPLHLNGFEHRRDSPVVSIHFGGNDNTLPILRITLPKAAPVELGEDTSAVSDESRGNPLFGTW